MDRLVSEDMENYSIVMRYINPYPDVSAMIGDSEILCSLVIGDTSTIIFYRVWTNGRFIQ